MMGDFQCNLRFMIHVLVLGWRVNGLMFMVCGNVFFEKTGRSTIIFLRIRFRIKVKV